MTSSTTGWNNPKKLLKLTMFRDPWSRLLSFYRYVIKCCEIKPLPLEWCREQCSWSKTPKMFLTHNCDQIHSNCNQLFYYTKAQYPNNIINKEESEKILDEFDLVLTIESLNEGLILLHLEYGIPFNILPTINANSNANIPIPVIPNQLKNSILQSSMQPDVMLYDTAVERLKNKILNYPNQELFKSKLNQLKIIQEEISKVCVNYFGDCITNDLGIVSEASCYYQCIDSIINSKPIEQLPYCKEDTCGTNGKFKKGCSICTCDSKNGAKCLKLSMSQKCLPLIKYKCIPSSPNLGEVSN